MLWNEKEHSFYINENMATSVPWTTMIDTFIDKMVIHHGKNTFKSCFYGNLEAESL